MTARTQQGHHSISVVYRKFKLLRCVPWSRLWSFWVFLIHILHVGFTPFRWLAAVGGGYTHQRTRQREDDDCSQVNEYVSNAGRTTFKKSALQMCHEKGNALNWFVRLQGYVRVGEQHPL